MTEPSSGAYRRFHAPSTVGNVRWWELSARRGEVTVARVLIVEDDARIGRLVARALEHDGHTAELAETGPDGLAVALAREFDLVILDLMLPGMGGVEVLERLVGERPGQRVLVL